MTAAPHPTWYVALTHAHAEAKALAHLQRQGFAVYLPRYLKRRRHARRVDIVPAPLFPRYLFIAIDLAAQRWRSVQSTVGVAQLVCTAGAPVPVAANVIAGLHGMEDEHGFVCLPSRPRFLPGDKIRVLDGAFASCLGLFDGATDGERVAILLDLLGRKVRVVIDGHLIAVA